MVFGEENKNSNFIKKNITFFLIKLKFKNYIRDASKNQ